MLVRCHGAPWYDDDDDDDNLYYIHRGPKSLGMMTEGLGEIHCRLLLSCS